MKLTRGQVLYLGAAVSILVLYGAAQARGWAADGKRQRPLERKALRQRDLGYRNHIFWYVGYRGK